MMPRLKHNNDSFRICRDSTLSQLSKTISRPPTVMLNNDNQ